jgi:hypothetical protein
LKQVMVPAIDQRHLNVSMAAQDLRGRKAAEAAADDHHMVSHRHRRGMWG